MAEDELNEAELTADEVLTFGPCVEAQVWHPVWIQEARAPIAVAAGRPRFGRVFDDRGVGKLAVIRPCVSRGRRIRGLPPIYTPQMLESNARVFDGWPMFMDHVDPVVQQALAKRGRSVKELGGQLLTGRWDKAFVHEDDGQYGYQRGSIVADVWATPFVRKMVGENPSLLHASINAWPTSGKPGAVPWRPAVKGMLIEGIRRQPQGSVDYVVRGGAGGRLLVQEGLEEEGAWPEVGEWSEDDRRFVVSLAESFYASPAMPEVQLPSDPSELRTWLQEHASHLLPALESQPAPAGGGSGETPPAPSATPALTEEDVRRVLAESSSGTPTVDELEEHLTERTEELLGRREQQRGLAEIAGRLIESAEGIPPTWKADLRARYSMLPSGAPAALLVESDEQDDDGNTLTEAQVIESRVTRDLQHVRDLIAEAQGKPRVTGEGGAKPDPASERAAGGKRPSQSFWRSRFVEMGLAESEDKAGELFGKVEG